MRVCELGGPCTYSKRKLPGTAAAHRRAVYPTVYGRSDPPVFMTARIYVRLQRLKIWYRCKEFASRRRLFLINIGTACSLYTLGDLLQQKIERKKRIDWKRTVHMATMGLACLGPLNHNWYIFLDKILPGTTVRIVTKKVLVDMLVMGPVFLVSFYSGKCVIDPPVNWEAELFFCTHTHTHTGMCLLEGKGKSDIVAELQAKFWPTYKVSKQHRKVGLSIYEYAFIYAGGLADMASCTGNHGPLPP